MLLLSTNMIINDAFADFARRARTEQQQSQERHERGLPTSRDLQSMTTAEPAIFEHKY